jgi:hypothetical protein
MQVTIKQKPFGYFKITPYLVFLDGELVGKVHRFRPLTLDVGKGEFNLTIKDNFFKSTRSEVKRRCIILKLYGNKAL